MTKPGIVWPFITSIVTIYSLVARNFLGIAIGDVIGDIR